MTMYEILDYSLRLNLTEAARFKKCVSEQCGVSRFTVYHWFTGITPIPFLACEKIEHIIKTELWKQY